MEKFVEVDQLKKKLDEYRPLDPEKVSAIQEKFRIEWTYHSRAIEGGILTLSETAFFLQEGLTTKGRPLSEYLETKNHAEALSYLDDLVQKKEEMSERIIKDFHAILMKDTQFILVGPSNNRVRIEPGKYKYDNNHVILADGSIHYFTDYLQVPGEMEKLVEWYKENKDKLHPIELSAILHHRLTAIHPFTDGNGRVARLAMNMILIQKGYTPALIRNEDKQDYYEALRQADEGKPDPFIAMVEKEVTKTITLMLNVIEGKEAFGLMDLDRRLDHFLTDIHSLDKDIGKVSKDSDEERAECQKLLHKEISDMLQWTVMRQKAENEFSFEIKPSLKIQDVENLTQGVISYMTHEQNIIPLFEAALVPEKPDGFYQSFHDESNIPNCCLLRIVTKRKYIPASELVFTVIPTKYLIYLNSMILISNFDFDKDEECLSTKDSVIFKFKSGSVSFKDWTMREIEDFFVESFNAFLNQVEKETERRRKIIAERLKK
jgi:Fic family protein